MPAKASGGFPDLASHPAEAIVAEAAEAGIVNGYPDSTFRPDAPVTRAEYIKLLVASGPGISSGGRSSATPVATGWKRQAICAPPVGTGLWM
ncbi:MAG: S-layer homology domain-containing protein [Firmicutes bacterium]|nr:S-layer homology domain-containing protein [Bacillota bacterium]